MLAKIIAALAPAISAVAMAAPAMAAPAENTTMVVSYADLDTTRADHAAHLAGRLERAAKDVCERPFIRDLKSMVAYDECVVAAMTHAQAQVVALDLPGDIELAAR